MCTEARRLLPLALALSACATPAVSSPGEATAPPPVKVTWTPEGAADGVEAPRLAALITAYWAWTLERSPLWATQLGEHRFDAEVGDPSDAAVAKLRIERREWLTEARAIETKGGLTEADQLNLELLIGELESDIRSEVCDFHLWNMSPRSNPVTQWSYLPEMHPVVTVQDGENLAARYEKAAPSILAQVRNLELGLERGLVTNRRTAELVLEAIDKQLAQPTADWPLMKPATEAREGWPEGAQQAFARRIEAAVEHHIQPALTVYAKTIREKVLPKARGPGKAGLSGLGRIGERCYAAQVHRFLGMERAAQALHELGVKESARIDAEMQALGAKLFGTRALEETLAHLRSDDASLYFDSADAIEAKAEEALARAKAAMPKAFGRLPKADCIVSRIPDYEAPYTTIAYYRPPVPDGSKPGEYFINVHAPTTRPRFQAEALAFHEAIPGHHLQIAIAQELTGVPAFRKHLGLDVYVEGWGLYAERLSDEIGLYSAPIDRLGMLSYEAWRAARLVVDTGLHALGWTREQATDYMMRHTALARNNIVNEVERYIAWPGQALAYKVGQLELLRIREEAKAAMGDRFDLAAFHDQVLTGGAAPIPVIERRVKRWSGQP